MKKIALLLSVAILAPIATTSAFSLFEDDKLRRLEDYRLTHRTAFEEIRGEDFEAKKFENQGTNKLYEKNVNEGLEDLKKPGVVLGRDCLNWKTCLQGIFWKTRGYNRSYLKKKITGNFEIQDNYQWIGERKMSKRARLNGDLTGKEKAMKFRRLSATKRRTDNRRNN